jgi:hypothetical protein
MSKPQPEHWTRDGKRYRLTVQGDQITLRGKRRAVTTWRWPWHSVSETLEQIGFQPDERPSQ